MMLDDDDDADDDDDDDDSGMSHISHIPMALAWKYIHVHVYRRQNSLGMNSSSCNIDGRPINAMTNETLGLWNQRKTRQQKNKWEYDI